MAFGTLKADKIIPDTGSTFTVRVPGDTGDAHTIDTNGDHVFLGDVDSQKSTSVTNTVNTNLTLTHTTTSTPANNIGVGIDFIQETSTSNNETIAQIQAVAIDTTTLNEDGAVIIKTMASGASANENARFSNSGLKLEQGVITIAETTTPSAETNYGKIYTKTDNNLYFQDGAGTEKQINAPRYTAAFWHTQNGVGSSSTCITKFTTEVGTCDDVVVTVDNSATLGLTVTANMDCYVHINFNQVFNDTRHFGLSLNSSQLTTVINSITTADRVALSLTETANYPKTTSWSGFLSSGDVVRPHTEGSSTPTNTERASFHVLAIEKL